MDGRWSGRLFVLGMVEMAKITIFRSEEKVEFEKTIDFYLLF